MKTKCRGKISPCIPVESSVCVRGYKKTKKGKKNE